MAIIETPSLERLLSIYDKGSESIVCTPFFSKEALALIKEKSGCFTELEFFTRGNVYDWVQGFAEFDHLSEFLKHLENKKVKISLYLSANLHAKIYACKNNQRAYLGSANLTLSAFTSNFEIMTFVENKDSKPVFDIIEERKKILPLIDVNDFFDLVDVCEDTIERVKQTIGGSNLEENKDFNAAVELVSEQLQKKIRITTPKKSKGRSVVPDKKGGFVRPDSNWPELEDFIEFCKKTREKEAKELVERHHGKSNLQGHIKHMFFGCLFFFYENPEMIKIIPKDLSKREKVMWSEEPWIGTWNNYLKKHANEFYTDISFNYHTLVTYLPTTLGGVQSSGGASSGNFKKVIYYLSKMLKENYKW